MKLHACAAFKHSKNSYSFSGIGCVLFFLVLCRGKEAQAFDRVQLIVAAGDVTAHTNQSDGIKNPGIPIEKVGGGDLLTLNSRYSGMTRISEGCWVAMGPLGIKETIPINISQGATLAGQGPIKGAITNSGTFSPSANKTFKILNSHTSIGNQSVIIGSLNNTETGVTELFFTPKKSDGISVLGAMNFTPGSMIKLTPKPGYYPETEATGRTAIVWGSTNNNAPAIVVTTEDSTQSNYLELAATYQLTINGLTVSFKGIDHTLPVGTTDVKTLASVCGQLNMSVGSNLITSENSITEIATKISIRGTAAALTAAPNSSTTISGEIEGGDLQLTGDDTSSVIYFNSNAPNYSSRVVVNSIKLSVNGQTGASINAGHGSILGGVGSAGEVTTDESILKPGNSIGTTNYNSLTANNTHYYVEMNSTQANKINVSTNAALSNFTVDVLMDADTYSSSGSSCPILVINGTLTGNVNTLIWTAQSGLVFDIVASKSSNVTTISLVSKITENFTLTTNQTTTGTAKRRIIWTDTTEEALTLTVYDYVSLIGGTMNNASGTQTISAPIAIYTNPLVTNSRSVVVTSSGNVTELDGILTGEGSLTLTGGGSINLHADNSGYSGDILMSSILVTVASTSNLGTGALSFLNATATFQALSTFNNNVSVSGMTVINANVGITFNRPLTGSGTLNLNGPITINNANPQLTSNITFNSSSITLANNADLGNGEITFNTPSTIFAENTTLNNTLNFNAPVSLNMNTGSVVTLGGLLFGNNRININTVSGVPSTINITQNNTNFAGTFNVTNANLVIKGALPLGNIHAGQNSSVASAGSIGTITLNENAAFKTGDLSAGIIKSISVSSFIVGNQPSDAPVYYVEINGAGQASKINVTGNTTLSDKLTLYVLMQANVHTQNTDESISSIQKSYPARTTDYTVLQSDSVINGNITNVVWVNKTNLSNNTVVTFEAGKSSDEKKIILKSHVNETFTLSMDQTIDSFKIDKENGNTTSAFVSTPLGTNTNESGENVSQPATTTSSSSQSVPVHMDNEHVTSIVQNNAGNNSIQGANDSASGGATLEFRFSPFKLTEASSKNPMETLLNAISKNGPASYENNETRLWVAPYVSRSRTSRRKSDQGSQGWAGGALIGLERRNRKNTWTLGLLGGYTGSRSHVLGEPDTFSKTKGGLVGIYNNLKYSDNWGHELLIMRSYTFVDMQRSGNSSTINTPFYALSNYRSTSDLGNAQLNYLFDIAKKSITARLNLGCTYQGSETPQYMERNAGVDNIFTHASSSRSTQAYAGLGIRKIIKNGSVTIRTTAVYEYGYQLTSNGTPVVQKTLSTVPVTYISSLATKQNKHYFQLNSSFLNHESGLKFIMAYSGTFYKNVENHTGMLKVEYRF